ncbi:hypothetical protein DQ400_17480 [Vreelandella sulfidaeris]|uniref:Uncharacterized protein n=1 Tax=Vreelandella sulfidaeris TaxID=115553 RepID=A0A365TIY8_9GAMM|nr:hypothetical protein [Halomonas sulfidaeris]RBI65576.1 hypothetical protein DQ400_17480 [Halomonas sulfidaeris]BBI64854.1 hypothetical protein HSBAA_61600 [Halomonas sulfidaeris]|tara:strand:- start:1391 stop:1750 length:360 start_codon:yes stop_codon:yes gene_type:complete
MKYATIIMQTLTASALVLGMAAQATAAEPTQTSFDTSSPIHGGTREGSPQHRFETEDGQAVDYQANPSYRTTFEAGSPALGGTREALYRERVKIEGNQTMSQQIAHSDHADNLVRGTRG